MYIDSETYIQLVYLMVESIASIVNEAYRCEFRKTTDDKYVCS